MIMILNGTMASFDRTRIALLQQQIVKTLGRGKLPGNPRQFPRLNPCNLSLLDFAVHPYQHTYHVFRPAVNHGASLDEQLYRPYGRSHLLSIIDLMNCHSHDYHCCHI